MKPATIVALANLLGKMAAPLKKNMKPGAYSLDDTVTLKVSGKIVRDADTFTTPTTSIPLLATLAIFIEKSGIVGDNIAKMLSESMQEALTYTENDDGELSAPDQHARDLIAERCNDIDAAMERVKKLVGDLPKMPKAGGTRCGDATFEVATFQPAEAA